MEKVPAEMLIEFVRSQKFTSTDEVMAAMKNMFKDILQSSGEMSRQRNQKNRDKSVFWAKKGGSHLSPGLKKFFQQGVSQLKVVTTLEYTDDCLSAVERLTAQIYGQLKRGRVCVETCSPHCI